MKEAHKTVCADFCITATDQALVRKAGDHLKNHIQSFVDQWYIWLSNSAEFEVYFGANVTNLHRVKNLQHDYWLEFFASRMDEAYFDLRRHVGAIHERINLPHQVYFAGMSVARELLTRMLKELAADAEDLDAMTNALSKQIFVDTYIVFEEINSIQNQRIQESSRAIMEMSTPVTPIWEGILLLPLLGIIDSARTQDIMTKTLAKIAETRAKYFVLDISGVAAVDTAVANQLIKITKAIQLMGCEAIISGISPGIARTIVELGVNVGEVRTTATLRDAFETALKSLQVNIA